uniref:Uncharacterized protein n=1 Tax=Fagus sylvatica TaxID=28930 RepID=A0A2N9G4M3_FAGSY
MAESKETQAEKRTLKEDNAVLGRPKKARSDNNGVDLADVTEDEVEEFFAILKRIHVAVSYFKKVDGNGDGEGGPRLRAILEEEEIKEEANGVKRGKVREEGRGFGAEFGSGFKRGSCSRM